MGAAVDDGQPIVPPGRLDEEMDDVGNDRYATLPHLRGRNGTWWFAAYHNVTAIVGAGVLGLPTTLVYLGWGFGSVVLLISWIVTLFTLWQMVEMHEDTDSVDENGEMVRIDTYYQLGQKAFGPRLGLWIVLPQQMIVQVGVNTVYMLTAGHSLWYFYQLVSCKNLDLAAIAAGVQCCKNIGKSWFIVIFAIFEIVFAQLGDFNSIASISLLASLTSICYCFMAWIDALHVGHSNHAKFHAKFANATGPIVVCPTSYQLSSNKEDSYPYQSEADRVLGLFSSLGVIAFAYAGHNVVLEIQASLPSSRTRPSKERMWRGVMVAYIVVAICYFPVAFAGYWAFGTALIVRGSSTGNPRSGNILVQLGGPNPLIAAANLFVAIHLGGSYLVYALPMFELLEKVLERQFGIRVSSQGFTSLPRILVRSSYVIFTAFLALTFPFFDDLLAFVGGLAITPTTYFLPCIIWLRVKRPKVFSPTWVINWVLIVMGVLLTIVASIGGLWSMVRDASIEQEFTYQSCTDTLNYPAHCSAVHLSINTSYSFYDGFTCNSDPRNLTICQVHFG